jgi:hypothetical protein
MSTQPLHIQSVTFGTFLGTVDGVDYWWIYCPQLRVCPSLLAVEGTRPDQRMQHLLPYGFKEPGRGVDLAKCAALHQERKAFWVKRRNT